VAPVLIKETKTMLRKMQADVLFLSPSDANPGIAALIAAGFDVEHLADWIDEEGPTVFFRIRITTEIDKDHFLGWVQGIVDPLNGDTIEAGLADLLPQSA
jgi:hypothetical protein